ncbi:MAG: hypothetical protein IJW16_00170 [Clostridia bacterium]|nr:hypothetical protein [Clostridia bacterium]
MICSEEKTKYFSQPTADVVGSATDPRTHVYQLTESGMMVRRVNIKSKKGGEPIEILQFTDTHLNLLNQRDLEENDPVSMSSYQCRTTKRFKDGATVETTRAAMALTPFFDQTVVSGDVIDYLTWGSLELMKKLIVESCPDVLMPIGMHDLVRRMQGTVAETTTLKERQELVKPYWPHDIFYESRVLGDKVMVIALNNCVGQYFDHQTEKFKADLERARKEDLVVLIFQHEQMCTRNPKETGVIALRQDDRRKDPNEPIDFCNQFGGNPTETDEESMCLYDLIYSNGDIIKGIFCGHLHCDVYTEISAHYYDENGNKIDTVIPQYVLTGNMYNNGHIMIITVE